MSDIKPAFASLEDASGVGQVLRQAVEGDSAAAKNGSISFSHKDASGNLTLARINANNQVEVDTEVFLDSASNPVKPQLDSEGRIRVSFDAAGVHKKDQGVVTPVDQTANDLATISLTASKSVLDIKFSVSCRKASLFKLIQLDDATETILEEVILDSGQYSFMSAMDYEIQTGATGTQSLRVTGQVLNSGTGGLSDLHASVRCKESVTA